MKKVKEYFIKKYSFHFITGISSFLLLLPFVFSTIDIFDSGELVTSCAELGIPHPPGYALFALLGRIFITLLFWLEPAYAVNLMSAFFSSFSAVILFSFLLDYDRDKYLSCIVSIMFVTLPFNLHVSTISEVYSLDCFILLLFLLFFSRFLRNNTIRLNCICLYIAGFAMAFRNINLVYLFPAILLVLYNLMLRFKRGIIFLVIPFSLLSYFFIRTMTGAHHLSLIKEKNIWKSIYELITSKIYQSNMSFNNLNMIHLNEVIGQFLKFAGYLTLIIFIITLLISMIKKLKFLDGVSKRFKMTLIYILCSNLFFLSLYRAMEIGTMAGYGICVFFIIFALLITHIFRSKVLVFTIFVIITIVNLSWFLPDRIDGNVFMDEYLKTIPSGSVLYAQIDYQHFPFYYKKHILKNINKDVSIRSPFYKGGIDPGYELLMKENKNILLTKEYYDVFSEKFKKDKRFYVEEQDGFFRLKKTGALKNKVQAITELNADFQEYFQIGNFNFDAFIKEGIGVLKFNYRIKIIRKPEKDYFFRIGIIIFENDEENNGIEKIFLNRSVTFDLKEDFLELTDYEKTQYYSTTGNKFKPGEYSVILYAKKIYDAEKVRIKSLSDSGYRKVSLSSGKKSKMLKDLCSEKKLVVISSFTVK